MRLVVTSKRPCQLTRGEVRRVPQAAGSRLVGYHMACPRCGFVTPVLDGVGGQAITEAPGLTFSAPVVCLHCRATVFVCEGAADVC